MNLEEIVTQSSKLFTLFPADVKHFPATLMIDRKYVLTYPGILISRTKTNDGEWKSIGSWYYRVTISSTLKEVKTKLGKLLKEALPEYKDDKIRDLTLEINAKIFPEDNLVLCTKPSDYVTMFKTKCGYSCMQYTDDYFGKDIRDKWRTIAEDGMYPSCLYHYSPEFSGVYLADKDGAPIARTHVALNSDGSIRAYGRPYGTPETVALIHAAFRGRKIPQEEYLGGVTKPFVVPGFQYKDTWLLPIPNVDDIATSSLYVKWDRDSTSFLIEPERKGGYTYISNNYNWKGYVVAPDMIPFS